MKAKDIENQIRDLINWVAVKRQEETQDVVTRIESQTAEELVGKLDALAVAVGNLALAGPVKKKAKKKATSARKTKKKKR